MPTILQVNATANWGSTGRIAEQINKLCQEKGWDCYIAYGRYSNLSQSTLMRVGSKIGVILHYLENRIFDNEGLASRLATMRLIKEIKRVSPDIIHLHNIHDHWLNYKLLFEYLNTVHIPVVWTLHDCWAFTGGCAHYTYQQCGAWQEECDKCPQRRSIIDRTKQQFLTKRNLFSANKNLHIVTVSKWLEQEVRHSFLSRHPLMTIYNGIDLSVFASNLNEDIIKSYKLEGKKILLALATSWSKRKGLEDYIALSKLLPENYVIMLVGLSEKMIKELHKNMLGIPRTSNLGELVSLYSCADVLLNLSYEETFGLTTVEAFACGTPAIVYDSTASPELVTPETGFVIEPGNIKAVLSAIENVISRGKSFYQQPCRSRAEEMFDKNKTFANYMNLYNQLISKNC